jgi:hypothetical protein
MPRPCRSQKSGTFELHNVAYKIGNDAFWSLLSIIAASVFTKLSYEHDRLLLFNSGENLNCVTNSVLSFSLFHRAFQFTIYNGPTNAFVCNKTLILMSHTKTLKIDMSICLSTQYNMKNEWPYAAA